MARGSSTVGSLVVFITMIGVTGGTVMTLAHTLQHSYATGYAVQDAGLHTIRDALVVTRVVVLTQNRAATDVVLTVRAPQGTIALEDVVVVLEADTPVLYRFSGAEPLPVSGSEGVYGAHDAQGSLALTVQEEPVELHFVLPTPAAGGSRVTLVIEPRDALSTRVSFVLPAIMTKPSLRVWP